MSMLSVPMPVRLYGHPFAETLSGHRNEFAVFRTAFYRVEVCGDLLYPSRIADEDHGIGQLARFQMQVEDRAVAVDNQFRGGDNTHGFQVLDFYYCYKSN